MMGDHQPCCQAGPPPDAQRDRAAARGLLSGAPHPLNLPATNDGLVLVLGLLIGAGLLVGMAFGVGAITLTAFAVAVVAAIVNPAVGLVTLAFMAPLKSPLGLPQPGLDALLVVAILAGCLYRLPIERPKLSLGAPLLFLLAFVLYAFVQQLPQMVSRYSGDEGTSSAPCSSITYMRRHRHGRGHRAPGTSTYPFLAALLVSASLAASLAILANGPSVGPPLANLLGQASDAEAIGPFGNPTVDVAAASRSPSSTRTWRRSTVSAPQATERTSRWSTSTLRYDPASSRMPGSSHRTRRTTERRPSFAVPSSRSRSSADRLDRHPRTPSTCRCPQPATPIASASPRRPRAARAPGATPQL